jgi:hypothetical protein
MLTCFAEVAQYESRPLILNRIYMSVCFGKSPTSSCEVPGVSVLCFAHSQAGDAGRKTKWGTVLKELFVSRCFSQIRFLLRKPKVRFCVHKCPATGLRHWNALHVSRPVFQKFSHRFLGLRNGLLPYGPDQNCV